MPGTAINILKQFQSRNLLLLILSNIKHVSYMLGHHVKFKLDRPHIVSLPLQRRFDKLEPRLINVPLLQLPQRYFLPIWKLQPGLLAHATLKLLIVFNNDLNQLQQQTHIRFVFTLLSVILFILFFFRRLAHELGIIRLEVRVDDVVKQGDFQGPEVLAAFDQADGVFEI